MHGKVGSHVMVVNQIDHYTINPGIFFNALGTYGQCHYHSGCGAAALGTSTRRPGPAHSRGELIEDLWIEKTRNESPVVLTQPVAKRLKLFGVTYLVGKISRSNLFFSGSIG